MARGDLPEQWALPLHTMPDALNDVAQTQAQTQATMNSMAGFLKSQSAAIVNMRAEAEVAKQERETMMGMLDALKNELGAVRAELDEGWAELGHVPSAAELERAVRERCVKEVAKEVGKSHRAMLTAARAEVEKLAASHLSERTETDVRQGALEGAITELQAALASKSEAADLIAACDVQEQRAASTDAALTAGLGKAQSAVVQLRVEVQQSLGRTAESAAVSQELEQVRMSMTQWVTADEVLQMLQRKQESNAIELRNVLEGKADTAAVEYALEDKLDCADAEAMLSEVAEVRAELGRLEITAITAAQTAEVGAADLGAAIGLERGEGGAWLLSNGVATGRGAAGSPAATLPRQLLRLYPGMSAATPGGGGGRHPQWDDGHHNDAINPALGSAPVMNLFGGGSGAEGLWTWNSSARRGSSSSSSSKLAVKGDQVFMTAADTHAMQWEADKSRVTVGTAGLYMITFGFFPKRLPANASREAWTTGAAPAAGDPANSPVGADDFSVSESAATVPAVNAAGGESTGKAFVSGGGQSCVRVLVDGSAAMDVHHFSTHTSPAHEATGVTRVDFLNLNEGGTVKVSCLGCDYGSVFLLLRYLG